MARTRGSIAKQEAAQAKALAKQKANAAAAVARTVFETAELLEMILLYFPVNKLLAAQRVNTFWKEGIRQSKKLQQALYLRPFGDELLQTKKVGRRGCNVDWIIADEAKDNTVVRPILNPIMPRYFFCWQNNVVSILNVGFVSPIFSRDVYEPLRWAYGKAHAMMEDVGPRSSRQVVQLHDEIACWRKMFVMQPPCSKIAIFCGRTQECFEIANPDGVSLHDLRSGLFSHLADCPLCTTAVIQHKIPSWAFEGGCRHSIQFLRDTPSGAELLACLENPEVAQLPGVMDSRSG